MTGTGEWLRRGRHWYDTTQVPAGGDAGMYFVHHRDIDRLRYQLSKYRTLSDRAFLIPQIEQELDKLSNFLQAYHMDVDRDMELTLAEINHWLQGCEIQRGKKETLIVL